MVGNNEGHQLNLLMFELGMITRDPLGILPEMVSTVAIHPFVVAPATIRYRDRTRSTVQETHNGALLNLAGRGLLELTCAGTFGVDNRALGLFVGTGDLRMKRFWHEIVRLSDAISKDQVDREKDPFRSPLLNIALIPYDPKRSAFFINFYDFWHGVQFQALVTSFDLSKSARGGASATGMSQYTLSVREVGPIVTGSLGTTLINGLFQALTVWDSVNELIKSYTADAIVGGLVNAGGILVSQFADTVNAVRAQIDGATGLLNGFTSPAEPILSQTRGMFASNKTEPERELEETPSSDPENGTTGLSSYLGNAKAMAAAGLEIRDALRAEHPDPVIDADPGAIRWGRLDGEGTIPALDAIDAQEELTAVIEAATFQVAAGAFYGMSREEYAAFLASTGTAGRPATLGGTVEHRVRPFDTALSIEQLYGVPWDLILRLNEMLPDEALITGTLLLIPRERQVGAPTAIAGLPVFGSHTGRAAWGKDLYSDLRVDADGALAIAEGEDVLVQGADWTIMQFAPDMMKVLQETPPVVQADMLRKRVSSILLSDRRISSVDDVQLTPRPNGELSITVDMTAINGGTISTGAATT